MVIIIFKFLITLVTCFCCNSICLETPLRSFTVKALSEQDEEIEKEMILVQEENEMIPVQEGERIQK